jgi:6-phosphogluconolactonase
MNQANINIHNSTAELYQALAYRWTTMAHQAIKDHGAFHVALAGGGTPKQLYQLLATEAFAATLPWQQTHIYFGDERCVAPEHNDSNYRMASLALLNHVPIPAQNIYRIAGENPQHEQAAADYEKILQQHLPQDDNGYHFDLVLLGLGPDGHIASLFPDTAILNIDNRLAAAVYVEKFSSWRISLTFPIIKQARHLLLVVAGSGKAEIIRQVLGHDTVTHLFPVQHISPQSEWHLDRDAASLLSSEHQISYKEYYDHNSGC